jgi:hypothetical protein
MWSLPSGFDFYGDSTSYEITVIATDTAQSGTISVNIAGAVGLFSPPIGPPIGPPVSGSFPRSLYVNVLSEGPEGPDEIIGPDVVRQGDVDITYSVPYDPEISLYDWALPGGFRGFSTSNSITVFVERWATSDTIRIQAMNVCGSAEWISKFVRVEMGMPEEDSITGPEWVCKGDSVMYTIPRLAAVEAYEWTLPTGFSGTGTDNYLYVHVTDTAESGLISVYGYNETDTSEVMSLLVEVMPLPGTPSAILGPSNVGAGTDSLFYSVSPIPGIFHYYWELPEGFDGFGMSDSIEVSVSDTAKSGWIKVWGIGFCGIGEADSILVTVEPVSILTPHTGMKYYPNPFEELLHISSPGLLEEGSVIEVYDLFGRMLMLESIRSEQEIILDFSRQKSGMYVVKMVARGRSDFVKVVKR